MNRADRLDATFAALADPTRRAILARLALGETSVSELAEPFAMSQPAISKHLKVLERAGLISSGQDAQRRPRRIEAKPLAEVNGWLEDYRQFWEASYERLDALLDELKAPKKKRTRTKRSREFAMKNTGTLKVVTQGDREVLMTRVFDAPRTLVFEALTKPELLKRWFGPREWTLAECEIDLRVGGAWRFLSQGPDGRAMGMRGVYREIVPSERLQYTESFDDFAAAGDALVTVTLEERRQDDADESDAQPVARCARCGDPLRHGAWRRRDVRSPGRVATADSLK